MANFTILTTGSLILWIVYKIFTSYLTERRHNAEARRRGCQPPPFNTNETPLAIGFVREALKSDRENKTPELIRSRHAIMDFRTFEFNILGSYGLSTTDPKNIQAILATQFKDFALGDMRNGLLQPLLGNGIFASDGKKWEHARALMRPQFTRAQVSDLDLEEQHVGNLMRALDVKSGGVDGDGWSGQVDLQKLFFRLTLDSACEFLLGESVDSQILNIPGYKREKKVDRVIDEAYFAAAFDRSLTWCSDRTRLADLYWLCDGPKRRRDVRAVHEFVDYFVDRAIQRAKTGDAEAKGKQQYVFLDALAAETSDPLDLRYQVVNILLAGRDTTASLLGWIFWLLARHPAVFHRLRSTIIAEFGPYTSLDRISFTSLKDCTYLQHVIKETLRLFPVVPVNMRQAVKDTTLPRGGGPDGQSPIFVPKGKVIDYSVYVMHRKKDLWGEDADEFNPDRWVDRKVGWEYLPFNGGPRICLGQQFALTEASYVVVRLLQRFDDIRNLDADPYAYQKMSLTSCPGKGVQVQLHEAV